MNVYDEFDECNLGEKFLLQDQVECFLCWLIGLVYQVWLVGLGVFGCVQVEGSCVFDMLVKEGEIFEVCNCEQVGDMLCWCDSVEEYLGDVCEKVVGIWDKVEKVFDDCV